MDMMGKDPVGMDYKLPTGKYKGKTVGEVLYTNARYIEWAAKEWMLILDKVTYAKMKEAVEVQNILWAKNKPELEKALDILRKRVERKMEIRESRRQDTADSGSRGNDDKGSEKGLPSNDHMPF